MECTLVTKQSSYPAFLSSYCHSTFLTNSSIITSRLLGPNRLNRAYYLMFFFKLRHQQMQIMADLIAKPSMVQEELLLLLFKLLQGTSGGSIHFFHGGSILCRHENSPCLKVSYSFFVKTLLDPFIPSLACRNATAYLNPDRFAALCLSFMLSNSHRLITINV